MQDAERSKPPGENPRLTEQTRLQNWAVARLRGRVGALMVIAAVVVLTCLVGMPFLLNQARISRFPGLVPWLIGAVLASTTLTLSRASALLGASREHFRWELLPFSHPLGYLVMSLFTDLVGSVTVYLVLVASLVPRRVVDPLLGSEMPGDSAALRLLFLGMCFSVLIGRWVTVRARRVAGHRSREGGSSWVKLRLLAQWSQCLTTNRACGDGNCSRYAAGPSSLQPSLR